MAHDHTHQIDNYNRAFAIGIGLNITFVIIEVVYGTIADSMALLADAGHNLSDVVSLVLAWGASVLAAKSTTSKRTYGLRKATVMASLVSAVILLVALGGIAWEAFSRFTDPRPVAGMTVMVVAAIGVVINTVTALLFVKGQHNDLNIKGAFLHMAADAAVSLGVVIGGVIIFKTGWLWVDPLISIAIVGVIFFGTWGLLKDSLNYAMDAVPDKIDMPDINEFLRAQERVERIHDLHVWPLSTTEVALTVHLVVRDEHIDNTFLHKLQEDLLHDFGIDHATFQIESISGENLCMLDKHTSC
ncbi:MAG: cation diffusion facilitator family transporter [Desulfuromonadaceae bacterium]